MIDKDNRVIDSESNNPIWVSNQKKWLHGIGTVPQLHVFNSIIRQNPCRKPAVVQVAARGPSQNQIHVLLTEFRSVFL